MPFDCPAIDTLAVLAKAEEYLEGGTRWMWDYRPNPEGRKCLLAAVKWAMLEIAQPLHGCDNEYWPTCADEYWPTPGV